MFNVRFIQSKQVDKAVSFYDPLNRLKLHLPLNCFHVCISKTVITKFAPQ